MPKASSLVRFSYLEARFVMLTLIRYAATSLALFGLCGAVPPSPISIDGEPCSCTAAAGGLGNPLCAPWIITNAQYGPAECLPEPDCATILESKCTLTWDSIHAAIASPVPPYLLFYPVDGAGSLRASCGGSSSATFRCPDVQGESKSVQLACGTCEGEA